VEYTDEHFRAVADSAIDAIITADDQGVIRFCNTAAEKIFGYPTADLIGKPLTTLMPERFRQAHQAGLARMVATGESRVIGKVVELAGLRKGGAEFPLELSLSARLTPDGLFFTGIIRDITHRKMVERRLAAEHTVTLVLAESPTLREATPKILQAICESLGWEMGAFWSVDQQANVLRCGDIWHSPAINLAKFETLSRQTTFAPGIGLPGRVWATGEPAWIPDVTRDANFPRAPVAAQEGLHAAFGFPIRLAGQALGLMEFFSRKIQQPDEDLLQMLSVIGSQIGQFIERKQAEERLKWLQQYTETILDSVPNPIVIIRPDAHVEYFNKAARQILNPAPVGEREQTLYELIRANAETQTRLQNSFEAFLGGAGNVPAAPFAEYPAGETAADPLDPHRHPGKWSDDRCLRIGSHVFHYVWFHVYAGPRDETRGGLVLRDITEESRLQDQLIQAEKWAGLGILTAGVGHELNNPLFSVIGFGEAILDENDPMTMREHAVNIVVQAKRMAEIIHVFTHQSHVEAAEAPRLLDVTEQLERALQTVRLTAGDEGWDVQKDYGPVPKIKARPEDIRQVFANIITNGIQAMNGRGTLRLATQAMGDVIAVSIQDSGSGIPQAYASKIFDPFFTTKGQGYGKGLGLTIVRRIMMKYGGDVQVESKEGRGTTFLLTFPTTG
jgi:PAS domain S-box-containing protein